ILAYSLSIFLGGLFGAKNFLNPLNFNTISASKHALSYDYINNFEQLKQEIQTNTKPIMLDFTASWCENCKLLDELTFSDERIIQKMQNYKLIKVDVSENNNEQIKTMKEFNVFGPPVLIFFENGKEKLKITGFISADDLLKKIEP
ncbi:thioredoxin fold domain-containing protein, partial [Campylobacter jejuni]